MLKKIDNYFLKEKIDQNEFEVCYKAYDNNNKNYLISEVNIQNKEFVDNKIKIIKKKNPKYSLEFIELIEKKDYFYMVMDLCDGNLNDLLKKKNGNLNLTTIFEIIFQLNEILKLMNSKEIEYINLNPENILIKNKNSIHIKIYDYNSKIKNYSNFYLQTLFILFIF